MRDLTPGRAGAWGHPGPFAPVGEAADGAGEALSVIYVLGASRTGSTIIANILGQLDGCFAVGELWNLWRRGLLERRLCGCGVPVPECPVWSAILDRAFDGQIPDDQEAHRLDTLARRKLKTRKLGAVLAGFGRPLDQDADDYRLVVGRLYQAVREVTGCRVIVDSSKGPEYGLTLASIPGMRVAMVNVVRDPRAVAFSAQRKVPLHEFGDKQFMERVPSWVGARRWLKTQAVTDTVVRSRQPDFRCVRYEDFSRDPRAVIADLAGLVGDTTPLDFLGEHSARLDTTHSVAGNPRRFETGLVSIRVDDEWRTTMPGRDRTVVTALTLPLLLHHGYPVRSRPSDDRALRS
jgi:hypothetical protein